MLTYTIRKRSNNGLVTRYEGHNAWANAMNRIEQHNMLFPGATWFLSVEIV